MTMEIPTPACALVRNDTLIGNAAAYSPLRNGTIPSGSGVKRLQTTLVTTCQRRLAALKQSLSLHNGFDLFLLPEMGIMKSIITGRGIGNAENGK